MINIPTNPNKRDGSDSYKNSWEDEWGAWDSLPREEWKESLARRIEEKYSQPNQDLRAIREALWMVVVLQAVTAALVLVELLCK